MFHYLAGVEISAIDGHFCKDRKPTILKYTTNPQKRHQATSLCIGKAGIGKGKRVRSCIITIYSVHGFCHIRSNGRSLIEKYLIEYNML
jgi:hypothetical protein